jgi:hypothetical protein
MPMTNWVGAGTIRAGDRVRLPFGSRRLFATRQDSEDFDAPFREVRRCVRGLEELGTATLFCWDGFRGTYPLDAFVLRERANGEQPVS